MVVAKKTFIIYVPPDLTKLRFEYLKCWRAENQCDINLVFKVTTCDKTWTRKL